MHFPPARPANQPNKIQRNDTRRCNRTVEAKGDIVQAFLNLAVEFSSTAATTQRHGLMRWPGKSVGPRGRRTGQVAKRQKPEPTVFP
jgi:hypothetical protein